MRYTHCLVTALVLLVLGGCAKSPQELILKDLQEFPQYTDAYTHNITPREILLAAQETYDDRYFEPWNYTQPPFEREAILWPHRSYTYEKSYGENLQPLSQEWFERMYAKGNYEAYGSLNKKAISLYYLNLRSFPTQKPVFKDPQRAGEGFPFDYLQNSGIHANEPLYVSHLSSDGAWAYVFTSYATGWVPLRKISFLDNAVTKVWKNARQIELVDEYYPITDLDGNFVYKSRVGMRLPLVSIEKDHYLALSVTAGKNHSPTYTKVKIPFYVGREGKMILNANNLKHIADLMLQSNYGWGGVYQERDCSSTLRDLYAPFGIWLPRNSSEQSKVGKVIPLEEMDLQEKEEVIIKEGVPFETLLYKKGHILLYLGLYNGKIAVLHNAWGVKTMKNGIEGRKIIGKTVISSLNIGKEREDYDPKEGILAQIVSMNILTQE
jgi:cell wall-associated NlpC family hydrolase